MVKIQKIQMRHFGYFSNNVCKHRRRRTFKYGSVKVSALLLFNLWKVHLISASEEPKMLFFQFTRAISSKANQYHHSLAPSLGPKKDLKKVVKKPFSENLPLFVKTFPFFFVSSPKLVEEKAREKKEVPKRNHFAGQWCLEIRALSTLLFHLLYLPNIL